jgi:hypothetical protein
MAKAKAKAKKRKPGINSRRKGAVGEVEFAHFLTDHGLLAERGQQHSGGVEAPDIKCALLPHVHFEVKRVQAGSPYKWLEQAIRDIGGSHKMPVVAHRRNDKEWIAILPMEELVRLLILAERHLVWEAANRGIDPDELLLGT